MKQYYKIAGLVVEMSASGRTLIQAQPYACALSKPDIVVQPDLEQVRARQPHLTDDECEYLATGGNFYRQLLRHNGLFLHASAVVADGRAYCFSGPCGAGKSTHAALWRSTFGEENILLLNDDKPALRLEDGVWYAYGTPWSGKTDKNLNLQAPLAGICFLRQALDNTIRPLTGSMALFSILEQTARPNSAELRTELLRLTESLVNTVPIWTMACNLEADAAILSRNTMTGK